jgi:hypothetical protein
MRRFFSVLCLAAGVAMLLAMGTSACGSDDVDELLAEAPVAAVQDDHLPVDPIEVIPERIAMIRELGVTTTRVDLFWSDIAPERPARPADPADPAYDWTRSDLIMRELADAGITPIISAYNSPAWATGAPPPDPWVAVNTAAPEPEAFAAFMRALVTRYRGDFVPAAGDEPLPAVRRFELWNEPNLAGFLTPQVADGRRVAIDNYAAMVKAAYPLMKRANPDAIVIAGVAGPRSSSSESGTGALAWLRGLQERGIPLDAYSQHIYPASAPNVETDVIPTWNTIDRLLDELDAFTPGLPLYITEAGYTTAATPYRDTRVTEEQQAQYLTDIFTLPQLATPRIPTVVWFNMQDNANWPAGLMREDLSRKPSYDRFVDVVKAQDGARLEP